MYWSAARLFSLVNPFCLKIKPRVVIERVKSWRLRMRLPRFWSVNVLESRRPLQHRLWNQINGFPFQVLPTFMQTAQDILRWGHSWGVRSFPSSRLPNTITSTLCYKRSVLVLLFPQGEANIPLLTVPTLLWGVTVCRRRERWQPAPVSFCHRALLKCISVTFSKMLHQTSRGIKGWISLSTGGHEANQGRDPFPLDQWGAST